MMSEWIKTSDRQPEQSGYYMVYVAWCGLIQVMHFSTEHGKWNCFDGEDEEWVRKVAYPDREIAMWCELPKRFKALAEIYGGWELANDLQKLFRLAREAKEAQDNG